MNETVRLAWVRGGLAAAVVLASVVGGVGPSSDKVLASASLASPVGARVMENCLVCFEWYCPSGWHDAFDWPEFGEDRKRVGGAHMSGPCWENTCDDNHPAGCVNTEMTPVTDADLEVLRTAIVARHTAAVSAMLLAHPKQLMLNVKRSAVQLVTCSGSIAMHMPVPAGMTTAISKAITTLAQ